MQIVESEIVRRAAKALLSFHVEQGCFPPVDDFVAWIGIWNQDESREQRESATLSALALIRTLINPKPTAHTRYGVTLDRVHSHTLPYQPDMLLKILEEQKD